MKSIIRSLLLVFAVSIAGCVKSDIADLGDFKAHNRVYYIYMASDDSVLGGSHFDQGNLDMLVNGATYNNIGKGRVIVFHDPYHENSRMLEIKAGRDGKGEMTILKEYETDLNSASTETFENAFADMKAFATAGGRVVDSYILDLWSHGTGWMYARSAGAGETVVTRGKVEPMNVVTDGTNHMKLEDFAATIEPGFFDAVVFAQCYSAGIEIAYLMRDKTDYMIGCATEMDATGFPYHTILPYIFEPEANLSAVCDKYYDYYQAMSGSYQTATVSLFDLTAFDDDFLDMMAEIYARKFDDMAALSIDAVQFYDYSGSSQRKYFDLGDLINVLYPMGSDLRTEFWLRFDKIVLNARATPKLFGRIIDPAKHSGMTTHIMFNTAYYASLNTKYKTTSWYRDVIGPAVE